MKATEQYFPVVLFIMLHKVVLTFESVNKVLWCVPLKESSSKVLFHDTTCFFRTLHNEMLDFRIFH